jgi:hypothetical protein
MPEWTEEEIGELGWAMEEEIRLGLRKKRRLLLRLAWKNNLNPDSVSIAAIHLRKEDFGSVIAGQSADCYTTGMNEHLPLPRGEKEMMKRKREVDREFLQSMIEEYGEKEAKEIMRQTK